MDSEPTVTAVESQKTTNISIVGLGHVGLPLAVEFDREGYLVTGFDVDEEKIQNLQSGIDPNGEVHVEDIRESTIDFTADSRVLHRADITIVAVPTPVDSFGSPDLRYVHQAGKTIGHHLRRESTVILESTVYPGVTRKEFVPAIEEASGLTAGEDFAVGYSPERMVPGDPDHGLRDVVKIVSGLTEDGLRETASLYDSIVDAGIHRAPSIEVAETAKCLENVQRDVNIALVNELVFASDHIGIDASAVLDAASTKWNFHEYRPGLVGGHCIPVDPLHFVSGAERKDYSPDLIRTARAVNDSVPEHVAELTVRALNDQGRVLRDSRVLLLGLVYKPNVGDVRTSAVGGVIKALRSYGIDITGYDPHADDEQVQTAFGVEVADDVTFRDYDAILVGTPHDEFGRIDFGEQAATCSRRPAIVDIDGTFESRAREHGFPYRRL